MIATATADDKADLPFAKLAVFGDSRTPLRDKSGGGKTGNSFRHDANVLAVTGAEGDYDGELMSMEAAHDALEKAGVAALLYTTPSCSADAPRWRVFAPFSAELAPADRKRHVARLNGVLGGVLAPESFVLSQSYYGGTVNGGGRIQTALIEGRRYLDEADDLDASAIGPREREAAHGDAEKWGRPLHVLRDALFEIPNDGSHPDNASREWWLGIGMALHFETDGAALDTFQEWSAQWLAYDADTTATAWESFGRSAGRVRTGRHILKVAEEHGWRDLEYLFGLLDEIAEPDDDDGLRVLSPDDCADFPEAPYVLKRFVAERDVVTVVGSPGVGKSVLVPRLAYAVAQGEPIFGMRTRQGRILYVATENERDMRKRVHALRREHGPAKDFGLVLDGAGAMKPSSDFLRKLRGRIARERPVLVVIDTLAAGVPGFEENTSEGMGGAIAMARSLTKWGAAVIVVHHDTKAGDGLPRGHSSLHGIVDANLALVRDGDVVRGTCSKNRNGPSHVEMLTFVNRPVTLGLDGDAEPITTVICEEADAAPRGAKLPPSAAAAFTVLVGLMEGRDGVSDDEWRKACVDGRTVSAADDADSRRRAYVRAVQELTRRERVVFARKVYFPTVVRGEEVFTDTGNEEADDDLV